MGNFKVSVEIGYHGSERFEPVEALVDTGVSYTFLPTPLLARLGLQPQEQRPFVLAGGREVFYGLAWIRVRIGGRIQPTIVVFGDPDSQPLLGAFTLDGFGLAADPVNEQLISVAGRLKKAS
jgi:clan AA aspartic protease